MKKDSEKQYIVDKNMRAVIKGVLVSGTPYEINALINLCYAEQSIYGADKSKADNKTKSKFGLRKNAYWP